MDSQGSREIGRKVELGREGGSRRVRGKCVSREGGKTCVFQCFFQCFRGMGVPGESKNNGFSNVFQRVRIRSDAFGRVQRRSDAMG